MKIRNCSTFLNKQKKISSIEQYANYNKDIPGPKYIQQWKWTDLGDTGNARPKGKFMTEEKVTMTASVMKFSKNSVSPNKYNKITQTWKKAIAPKVIGTYNNRAEKICFIDEV